MCVNIYVSTYQYPLFVCQHVGVAKSAKRTSVWCLLCSCLELRFCSRSQGRRVHNHGKIRVEQLYIYIYIPLFNGKNWKTYKHALSKVDEFRASFATCLRGSTTRAEHFGNRMLPKAQKQMAVQTSPKGKFGARSAGMAYRKDQTFSSRQDPSVMNVCTDLLHGKLL